MVLFAYLWGSIPDVGSSRKTIFEPPIRAMPTDSFRFCPPERVFVRSFFFSARPTSERVVYACGAVNETRWNGMEKGHNVSIAASTTKAVAS